jgi:hypothetical protein
MSLPPWPPWGGRQLSSAGSLAGVLRMQWSWCRKIICGCRLNSVHVMWSDHAIRADSVAGDYVGAVAVPPRLVSTPFSKTPMALLPEMMLQAPVDVPPIVLSLAPWPTAQCPLSFVRDSKCSFRAPQTPHHSRDHKWGDRVPQGRRPPKVRNRSRCRAIGKKYRYLDFFDNCIYK